LVLAAAPFTAGRKHSKSDVAAATSANRLKMDQQTAASELPFRAMNGHSPMVGLTSLSLWILAQPIVA